MSVRKNDVRMALMEFYCRLIPQLDNSSEVKKKELESLANRISLEIKQQYQASIHKGLIRKALKGELRRIRILLDQLSENNKVRNQRLLYDLFGGLPLSKDASPDKAYDVVIKLDNNRTKSIVFAPSDQDEGYDTIQAQHQAEFDYELHCAEVEELCLVQIPSRTTTQSIPVIERKIEKERAVIISNGSEDAKPSSPKPNGKSNSEIIGKVLFNRKDQLNLRADQNKDEIKGFIFEEFIHAVKPLDILVIENDEQQIKIFTKVIRIDVNPLSGGGFVSKFSEIATRVLFQPIMEVSTLESYKGRLRPKDLSGYAIRKPDGQELREVFNIPHEGLPLGWLDYGDESEVFRYPLHPEDTLYQSVMIAGVQGKGKSNELKLLIRTLSSYAHLEPSKRPAIIILDGEGEYKKFAKKSEIDAIGRGFLDVHGIGDIEPHVYTIDSDLSKSDATLSLRGIDRQDLVYLMPELESRTENILQVLMNNVGNRLDYEKAPRDIHTLRNRLIQESNSSGLVHMQQRPAIARAVLSPALNLLDQAGKTPITPGLITKPGTVSVIDYQGLDQNRKRVVALYILQMLSRFKMDAPNYDPGILLVIDEAELLFPANPSKGDKDYVQRIASKMEDITNRGRKRKYGVVLVTHLPSEVSDKVGNLANTKIAFGCSGADTWIRDNFGREYVSEISNLPTGSCRVRIKVENTLQGQINTRIRVPFVGKEEKGSTAAPISLAMNT